MGQKCSDAPRASHATTMLSVGLGCLLALFLILVHRSGAGVLAFGADGWHPFVTGAFAGMALAAIAAALLCAKDPYRPPDDGSPVRLACPVAACLLLAMGWAASCATGLQPEGSFSIASMAWDLPAMAVGCGAGLLVLPFGTPFAALNRQAALSCLGCGLLVAAALDCLSLAFTPAALPILGAACTLAAAAAPPAAQAIRSVRAADDGHADPRPSSAAAAPNLSTAPSATKRLAALAADTWRPVVGAFICLFIFGFTWNVGLLGVQLNAPGIIVFEKVAGLALAGDTWRPVVGAFICLFIFGFTWNVGLLGVQLNAPGIIVFEKVAGLALAGATLLVLSRLHGNRDPLVLLLNVVLPLLVVTFIVRPYLISLDLGSIGLNALGVARETGFVLFLASAWIALAQSARQRDVSATFAAAVLVAGCGVAGLLGLYGPQFLGGFLASAWIALAQSARQRDVSATFAAAVLVAGCGVAGLLGLYGPQFLGGLLNYMGAILFTLYLVRDVSATFAAAVLVAGCGVAGLLGLYGPQFLGGLLNYMGAILFTLYLVIVVVVSTASQHAGGPTPAASDAPIPDLGRMVEERCEQVAREHNLTPREGEIVLYLGRGHSYAYIANALTVSENTVRTHVERCEQVAREHNLTPREGEIVLYLGRGHSYAYIANALTVSENTVRTHVRNIYRKLGVTSREELLAVVHGEDGGRE